MGNLYKEIYSIMDQGVALNRLIFDKNGDAIDYITLEVNQSYADMLGIPVEDIVGRSIFDVLPTFNKNWITAIGNLVKSSDIKRYEKYNVELDKYFEIIILPNGGNQFILLSTDVTENRQKERQMASLVEELTASEEELRSNYMELEKVKNTIEEEHNQKDQFLAGLNQEIKMPLNGILAFSRLLEQTEMDNEQHKFLTMIQESCVHLMELMDNLVDREENKQELHISIKPTYKKFRVRDSLLRIAKEFAIICDNKKLKFNFNMGTHIPLTVIGDELAINQVLAELLNNLVKYTSNGEISLKADKIFQMDKKITLKFELKDTGLKLKKEDTGLAENIIHQSVLELVKSLNGQLWIEENEDNPEGSIFFTAEFLIDIAKFPEAAEIEPALDSNSNANSKRILLVEENQINMKIITEMLKKCGYNIICAASGMEAVHQFIKNNVDLILLDIHMPDQDGYETTSMIRRIEVALGTHVPIIGTMATSLPGTRELCINAGMEDYILKPFDKIKFQRTIQNYI